MNGSNSITHHTEVFPSESKPLGYEATIMLARPKRQTVQEERTERRWKRLNHSSNRFWVSLILSPYVSTYNFWLKRLFSREQSIRVLEDIGLCEIDQCVQNSLMLPVEKVYTRHLSQEKSFRGGYLNKKGKLSFQWDEYPLRSFLLKFTSIKKFVKFLLLSLYAEYSLRECKNKIGKKSGFTFLSLNSSNLVKFNIQNQFFMVKK